MRRGWLGLCVLVYALLAIAIYRASWSALAVPASEVREQEAAAETRIQYHHYTWVGLQYYKRRDYQSAESSFRKSIAYGPDQPLAYNNVGSVLNAEGRWDEAIMVLERGLALDPSLTITRNNLAWAREERAKRSAPSRDARSGTHDRRGAPLATMK